MLRTFAICLFLPGVLIDRPALALPSTGQALPSILVQTVSGDRQGLPSRSHPTLILYESRASRPQNYPLKTKLKLLAAQTPAYRQRVLVVPIANLEAYNFWPLRGLAANAVQSEVNRLGSRIYCDWNGSVAQTLGVRKDLSSVILVAPDGTVLFAAEGPLTDGDQARVLDLLKSALAED